MADSVVVALDSFDPIGTTYMRELFPGIIEPGHPLHANWTEHAVGLLVGSSPVSAHDIRHAKRLRYIVRHGVGYDGVDITACKERGVILCNCPGTNAESVAEVALSLTCAAAKNLREIGQQIREGQKLSKKSKSLYSASLLSGKVFGILGGGTIGFMTAKKFYGAFDAQIVMYDPYVPSDGSGSWGTLPHNRASSVKELVAQVDVLSLHLPLLPSTKDLITASLLKTMKPTAIIVNTARGGIVNEPDLFAALQDGTIAAAGIDAWVSEPPTREVYGKVLDLDNIIITPHIGAAPLEVQTALCRDMCDHMKELMEGKSARDRVV